MGQDYSTCLGYERNKQTKPDFSLTPTNAQPHNQKDAVMKSDGDVLMTANEAFMLQKQQTLKLHLIPCAKLKQRFFDIYYDDMDSEISKAEFCAVLADCKLLKADFPGADERWKLFYSRFVVVDDLMLFTKPVKEQYRVAPALIALLMLSEGTTDFKAKAICEVISGKKLLQPTPLGIRAQKSSSISKKSSSNEPRNSIDERARSSNLTKEQLKKIVSIIVNVALTLLPAYASEQDSATKADTIKLLIKWHIRRTTVTDNLLSMLSVSLRASSSGNLKAQSSGNPKLSSISVRQFVDRAKSIDLFNVMMIRELAKQTLVISDINPQLNRETALQRDLFRRQTEEALNETLTETNDFNLQSLEAKAYLYRTSEIQSQQQQFFQTEQQVKHPPSKKRRRNAGAQSKDKDTSSLPPQEKLNQRNALTEVKQNKGN